MNELLLTFKDVEQMLGVSRNTLRRLIKEDGLPVVDLGSRNPRIRMQDFEQWLDSKTVIKQENEQE